VPAVFVIGETTRASCSAPGNSKSCTIPGAAGASTYATDGTITIIVPKAAFGPQTPVPTAPAIGTLLGGVNGRTLTGDTPGSAESKLERSTAFIDHTFVKAQTDQGYPAATYLVSGNNTCSTTSVAPIGAVSRKVHGSAGTFNIDLPLTGPPGIECRSGVTPGDHTIVVTFPTHVNVASATCAGQSATKTSSGTSVTVNCTGVPENQFVNVTLTGVSDGTNTANVSIPMGVLKGDVNANKVVTNADVSLVKAQVSAGGSVNASNFRNDVNANGVITNADVSIVKTQVAAGAQLP